MIRWFRHPHETHLSEYAEGTLSPEERRRVADHLADCTRCRNRVRFIRELRTALRELPTPTPRSTLFEEIWERREAGERRILPVAPPAPPPARRPWLAAAAVVLALLGAAAGYLLLAADAAVAGASELGARPAGAPADWRALDGMARWSLTYESAGRVGGASRARVRALYRLAGDPPFAEAPQPRLADAILTRDGDRFEGEIALPPPTAYALLGVETSDGRRHDPGRSGEPWEILARTPDGRPTYEALRQKLEVEQRLVEDGWRRDVQLLEVTRDMTDLYPFRPLGWFHRYTHERRLVEEGRRDSLRAAHRMELQRLDAHLRAGAAYEAEDLAGLLDYASTLESPAVAARARTRLERVAPDHPTLARRRVAELVAALGERPARLLEELDAEWRTGRASGGLALQVGVLVARQLGSGEEVLRWVDRAAPTMEPAELDQAVLDLLAYPSIAEATRERLRERIRWNAEPPDDLRLPIVSREVYEAAAGRRLGRLLAGHGESLLASGSVEAAIDTLREALAIGWRPEAAETLARAYERSGQPARADSLRAVLAADPLREADAADPGTSSAAGGSDAAPVRAAAAELLGRMVRAARIASLPDSAVLPPAPGESGAAPGDRALGDVRVGVVALWQVPPAVPGSDPVWGTLDRWRERLAAAGVETFVLLSPSWAYEAQSVRELTGWSPLVDVDGEVLARLGVGWAREYAVLDDGRAWVHAEAAAALRHALLLARETS